VADNEQKCSPTCRPWAPTHDRLDPAKLRRAESSDPNCDARVVENEPERVVRENRSEIERRCSRIRERYDETGDTTDAVTFGVSSTARIITGAALIILAVFAGFAAGELVVFQQMGFGVAVALLIDATIIRSVLLPATMHLLGRWNWYLPRRLEWLPRIEVEHRERPFATSAG
jgi:MMPL family